MLRTLLHRTRARREDKMDQFPKEKQYVHLLVSRCDTSSGCQPHLNMFLKQFGLQCGHHLSQLIDDRLRLLYLSILGVQL